MSTKLSAPIVLENYNLSAAEQLLCERALEDGGSIVLAAERLGITRHALKRRIVKLGILWPRPRASVPTTPSSPAAS